MVNAGSVKYMVFEGTIESIKKAEIVLLLVHMEHCVSAWVPKCPFEITFVNLLLKMNETSKKKKFPITSFSIEMPLVYKILHFS